MKKHSFFFLMIIPAFGLGQSFSVSGIPDTLTKGANAVVRIHEVIFEIKSPGKAVEHEHFAYTILNEDADFLAKYDSYYGSFISINYAYGTLYDAMGKQVKKIKLRDMGDFSVNDGFSLMNSERVKRYDFYNRIYPYTVDYEEEDEINGLMDIGEWMPRSMYNASVVSSRFVVIAPRDYKVRYKPVNCSIEPIVTEEKDKRIYTWEAKNLPAQKKEPMAPPLEETMPYVIIAPSDFEVQGYKGNMNSWENYGRFMYQLVHGRDLLPDNTRKKVHEITDTISDRRRKVLALYRFLQATTHYVGIQLGIGGWQPFDATYVATKNYGDCKALSNYMIALLKEAGINGKYVEIRAGKDELKMVEDFPSFQSNHVTCAVPMDKDTIWLECTDQAKAAGYAGSFTGNRKGVVIDETGGHIVKTPVYTAKDNLQCRHITGRVSDDGNLDFMVKSTYHAEKQDELSLSINELSRDKVMERLKTELNLPTYDVTKFNYQEEKDGIPIIDETLEINAPRYAQVSGKRLFISPNIMTRSTQHLNLDSGRKADIELHDDYTEKDTVDLVVPSGYQPEAIPAEASLDTKFGKYFASYKVSPEKIEFIRFREQHAGRFSASAYGDMSSYFEKIYRADRGKIVLVRKE
ncbi:MAG TPA: DUF3857 domain-containing protein [Puia sp.]|nr:DUF3857 domain-containing protein [Puia sp.]